MWKLLRNLVIVAVLFVAVLKLLLWYETQQGAARLAERLAPVVQLRYDSVSSGLDGNVTFHAVNAAIGQGAERANWRAAEVDLDTPGALWLIRRVLLDDNTLPERLGITVHGLQIPAAALGPAQESSWLSPLSLVPFETRGCGIVSRFSVADYQRMGLNPGAQQQHLEYRYDAANAALAFAAQLDSPPFSSITLHGDLQKFDPQMLSGRGDWQKLHVAELALGYVDTGYLAKRNRFCAQQAGTNATQFVDQHVAAVQAFLAEHGVQPSDQVTALYRSLAAEGGRVTVLSLPSAGSTAGQLLAETPDAMTRRLNLTARRNEAPPVMVRLGFRAPEAAAVAATGPDAATALPAATVTPTTAAVPAATPPALPSVAAQAPVAAGAAAAKPPVLPAAAAVMTHPAPPPSAVTAHSSAAAAPARAPALPVPTPVASGTTPVASTPARDAPAKATPDKAASPSAEDPATALPSGPAPPPDSTLALVWKPTVDRLAQKAAPVRDYDVVEVAALGGLVGRNVRLVTTTQKRVEGRVLGIDATAVALRIQNAGGTAELQVPRSVIVEVQLPRRRDAQSSD